MSNSSTLATLNPVSLRVEEVFICNLNPMGSRVGFSLKMASSRHKIYATYDELLDYLKKHKRIKNVEIFKKTDPEGLLLEPFGIRSIVKSFSLSKGTHVINIDELQRKTWRGELDPKDKVQLKFTTLY